MLKEHVPVTASWGCFHEPWWLHQGSSISRNYVGMCGCLANEPSTEAMLAQGSCICVHWIISIVQLGQDNLYDTLSLYLSGWFGGTLGVVFLSGTGLVTHSGLLGLSELVVELLAHFEEGGGGGGRGVALCESWLLVGGTYTSDSLTGSWYVLW
jgi:hypothetical protein